MSSTVRYRLTLYIARHAPGSREAIGQLRALCEEYFSSQYELQTVELSECAAPVAVPPTPPAVRALPYPIRRHIADLADMGNVLAGVSMDPA